MRRVADIIMDILVENGITDCFAVVGGGAMHLNNALALNDNINKYFNHHEQACSMAASSYAYISGKPAAVIVTSGPGATNAITGVMGAWQDGLPMIVISGQVRYETTAKACDLPLRYRGIQEFDIIGSVQNMTKYAKMIIDPLSIKHELQKAIDISFSGRRGPVWLDIPLNVQSSIIEEDELYSIAAEEKIVLPGISDIEVKELFELIKNAERPCFLAGTGLRMSNTVEQFVKFAEISGVPVIGAALAADVMYREHPNYFGLSGFIGPRTGNFILQNADLIVSFGSSLGFKTTGFAQNQFAPKSRVVAIDVDEFEMQKPGLNIYKFIHSDLSIFFEKIENKSKPFNIDEKWLDYCNMLKNKFTPFEAMKNITDDERVCSYNFWKKFEEYEPSDSISALGNNTGCSSKLQIGTRKENQRIVTSPNCGSMGLDLPAAIGAAIASKKDVFCVTGEGSIMMNLQELQTIVHYKLPVKLVIFSNDGYAAIRQTSKNFFNGVYVGCTPDSGISFPDFEKLASVFDSPYHRCNCNGELDESLEWLCNQNGFAILEIMQKLDDPVTPKVMSRMNADGTFSTPALQDMAPFLDKEEIDKLMLW
ncbi:thiamine pyrophosphate-binding protein [Paenibacillus sp. 1011MAR3C5]|uniref:thiamine pyrophosphate-binding protein n=1 Tax=Paenibacillus sp. 1011MAR3C5 TaxID=1675787 RepID=UPI000E6B69E3|nr:thiamine pyrophosphate-binding protein [Paenibacillus sp. 1011MAR3C5]RJE85647.1 thiamine pyrophosphate-binding protein [Paenibacillus sp. 1011MAR3C5]